MDVKWKKWDAKQNKTKKNTKLKNFDKLALVVQEYFDVFSLLFSFYCLFRCLHNLYYYPMSWWSEFHSRTRGNRKCKTQQKKQKQTKDNKTCKTVKLHLFILTKKNQKKNINAMCITFIHSILVDVFSFPIIDREEKILTETRNMIKIWACFVLFFHFILFIYFVTTQQNKTKKTKHNNDDDSCIHFLEMFFFFFRSFMKMKMASFLPRSSPKEMCLYINFS